MNAAQKWRGLRIEEELCDAGAVASVFRDVAFALMKAEAHEGGTESFEVQVIFGIHRKQPDVFPHLFALIEEFPPCHAGIVGIDCHIDQAGIYRSRQATAY